jgi:hypothetical protein
LSREDYDKTMLEAKKCEEFIANYEDRYVSPTAMPGQTKNFAVKAYHEQFNVSENFKKAFHIYSKFKMKDESINLLDKLFWLVGACDEHTVTFAIRLLLSTTDTIKSLEKYRSGTKEKVREKLLSQINAKLHVHEMDFWFLGSAIQTTRRLAAGDHEKEKDIDEFNCQLLQFAAQSSFATGNLANSSSCYAEAAKIAQQLGDAKLSQNLAQKASQMNRMLHSQPLSPDSVEGGLNKIINAHLEDVRSSKLLPTLDEMKEEYSSVDDKLDKLLNDNRLLIDDEAISESAKKHGPAGLLNGIPSRNLDEFGNSRTDYRKDGDELTRQYEIKYIMQVADVIGVLFSSWQETGELTEEKIISLLPASILTDYDWRIFEHGLHKHFEKDYVSSVHLLIPQLEDVLRNWAEKVGISPTKLTKGNASAQKLFNDLTNDSDVQARLGDNLVRMINWYFVDPQFNFRNKVAHGFMAYEGCNLELSSIIIWLSLLIAIKPLHDD